MSPAKGGERRRGRAAHGGRACGKRLRPYNSRMSTAYFIGAGASRAAGYPLTDDLFGAIAWAIRRAPEAKKGPLARRLAAYLHTIHGVSRATLDASADDFESTFIRKEGGERRMPPHPSVVDILSMLDVLFAEGSHPGSYARGGRGEVLNERELHRTRERLVGAICLALNPLERHSDLFLRFVERVRPGDVIVTTNWDFLIDTALQGDDSRSRIDYGTDAIVVCASGERELEPGGGCTPLLKLHGSLNWLTCRRCTRLYANPNVPIATLEFRPEGTRGDRQVCDCGMRLSHLLMTPTFVKTYNNRHILNIWGRAIQRMAECEEWVFIGYSLPQDDLGVRAMLLKAATIRSEAEGRGRELRVRVVTKSDETAATGRGEDRSEEFQRYRLLFGRSCELMDGGFEGWLERRA